MKTTKILYWVFNILFAGVMFLSGIPALLQKADEIKGIHDGLGYPVYFIPFIGLAKILGAMAILIPGYPRLKEWALLVQTIWNAIFHIWPLLLRAVKHHHYRLVQFLL